MNRSPIFPLALRLLPALMLALLAGCVVVPEGGPAYGSSYGYGYGYGYAPAPVYVAPAYPAYGYGYGYRPHYRGGWR